MVRGIHDTHRSQVLKIAAATAGLVLAQVAGPAAAGKIVGMPAGLVS